MRLPSKTPTRSGSFCILDTHVPTPGVDYPTDDDDFGAMLPDERSCRRLLERLRFPRGFVCGRCGVAKEPWRSGTGLLGCMACRHPVPLTAGTLFDGSTVALARWTRLLWELTQREGGLDDEQAGQLLAVSDAAAHATLSRVRELMGHASDGLMSGEVELATVRLDLGDESPAGARPVIAVALGGHGSARRRVRLRVLPTVSAREIVRFVVDHVEEGTRVITSPWHGFKSIQRAGYHHIPRALAPGRGDDPRRVVAVAELWLGSYRHAMGAEGTSSRPALPAPARARELSLLLDDFAFRYNRRDYPRGLLFYRLMILAVTAERLLPSRRAGSIEQAG